MASPSKKWKRAIQDFLSRKLSERDLQKLVQDDESERNLPTLAIASLNTVQVQKMLGLQLVVNDLELDNVPSVRMPSDLVNILSKIDKFSSRSDANESNIRWTLNMLLVFAYDIATSSKPTSGQAISAQTEKTWGYGPVKWIDKRYKLIGKPDYAIWYGEVGETAVNIVIVEAKRRYLAANGLVQCLAYMGIVHRLRKEAGKQNCTVYGMAADDQSFLFRKIKQQLRVVRA
ncbi:hypothetical protein N7475_007239 [Penicillium sp. IBT 31633x]|nr:hypothetical protein N7475_007239 [Penicillium sp. IBT 31633x]